MPQSMSLVRPASVPSSRRVSDLAALGLAVLVATAVPAEGRKGSDLLPHDEFMPVTKAQRALTEVDFAPGASAVVLFDGEQLEWERSSDEILQRVVSHRRVKVLDEEGVERHGRHVWSLLGRSRVHEVAARTVLPDGTVVDCSDCITQSGTEAVGRTVAVEWPRVEPGAILDLRMHYMLDTILPIPYRVQQYLPVVESRLVVLPPGGFKFGSAVVGLSGEEARSDVVRRGPLEGVAWTARDVPPIPDVPFRPPVGDFAATIYLTLESYPLGGGASREYASDWPTYARTMRDRWKDWLRGDDGAARALAKSVTSEATTPREKAEAIRRAIRERVEIDRHWDWPRHDDADEVLKAGRGRSADAVGLALAMLDAAGLEARPVGFRPPDEGRLPEAVPVTSMIEDVLVEVLPKEGDGFWLVPWSDAAVGEVPSSVRGALGLPYDRKVEGLVELPAWTPDSNAVEQVATLDVGVDGSLEGTLAITRKGEKAEAWRVALAERDPAAQAAWLAAELGDTWPGLEARDVEIDGLEDPEAALVVRAAVRSDDAVRVAGGEARRLLVKPVLFERMDARDLAAESRSVPIDLDEPFRSTSRVVLRLPRETTAISVPPSRAADGGPAGRYELTIDTEGHVFTAERRLEMRQTRFPAGVWSGLQAWFGDMAGADDGTLEITLRPPS